MKFWGINKNPSVVLWRNPRKIKPEKSDASLMQVHQMQRITVSNIELLDFPQSQVIGDRSPQIIGIRILPYNPFFLFSIISIFF
jgi:hypothetical protein